MDAGDAVELHATGQRIVFRVTAHASGGEAVVFESLLPPAADGLTAEAGGGQEQRFEVLRGSLRFAVDGVERLVGPGDRLTVPRGAACRYWNDSTEPVHLVAEVRPALAFEAYVHRNATVEGE